MARFLGAIQGRKGAVTRLGSAPSGIHAQAQGWDVGVTVEGNPFALNEDLDQFAVFLTGGSNGHAETFMLGDLRQTPSGKRIFILSDEAVENIRAGSNVIEVD